MPDCKARLYVSDAGAADLHPGDEITADVKLRPSTLRYGEETDSYISKGIYLIGSVQNKTLERTGVWSRSWLYWPKTVAQSLKASAQTAFPADVLPFAQALMLGDKSALYAQDLDIPFSTTGIMHTVAVSGLWRSCWAFCVCSPATGARRPSLACRWWSCSSSWQGAARQCCARHL